MLKLNIYIYIYVPYEIRACHLNLEILQTSTKAGNLGSLPCSFLLQVWHDFSSILQMFLRLIEISNCIKIISLAFCLIWVTTDKSRIVYWVKIVNYGYIWRINKTKKWWKIYRFKKSKKCIRFKGRWDISWTRRNFN